MKTHLAPRSRSCAMFPWCYCYCYCHCYCGRTRAGSIGAAGYFWLRHLISTWEHQSQHPISARLKGDRNKVSNLLTKRKHKDATTGMEFFSPLFLLFSVNYINYGYIIFMWRESTVCFCILSDFCNMLQCMCHRAIVPLHLLCGCLCWQESISAISPSSAHSLACQTIAPHWAQKKRMMTIAEMRMTIVISHNGYDDFLRSLTSLSNHRPPLSTVSEEEGDDSCWNEDDNWQ